MKENNPFKLYWKDIEIEQGSIIQVVESGGDDVAKLWKILEVREKTNDHEYYEPFTGNTYPLKKVMKSKKLYRKSIEGELVQIPPSDFYLVLEERIPGSAGHKRCFNVDMLETLRSVKIIETQSSKNQS